MTILTIFEGPDCAGKSTAIGKLFCNPARDKIIHHGVYPDHDPVQLMQEYTDSMTYEGIPSRKHLVLDRSWISEAIYGTIYRGVNRINGSMVLALEQIALPRSAVIVLCLPPLETVLDNYRKRKADEYIQNEPTLIAIYKAYEDFYVNRSSNLNIIKYDYMNMPLADLRYSLNR